VVTILPASSSAHRQLWQGVPGVWVGGNGFPRRPSATVPLCIDLSAELQEQDAIVRISTQGQSLRNGLEEGATIEDVYLASVETDRGVKEQLRLYDTRGLQEGVELPKHYFSVADGFVLVYAVTSLEAFQRVELLKKEIDVFRDKKEVAVIVLGNKTDLVDQRQVETEAAQQWARAEKVRLWEVTVTDRKTLLEPFTFLASKLSQSQNKSTFPLPGRKSKGNNCEN
uniref:NFKB inhibitor interacting Ras like 1 n=1 Tax=Junco hyemalis TaxID=40217 RepID=A0A8C5IWE7_JUNHY